MEDKRKEGMRLSPRTGRPTDNPKNNKITVRLDDEATEILKAYCEQEGIEKGERKKQIEIAKELLKMGMKVEEIERATKLPKEQIKKLIK